MGRQGMGLGKPLKNKKLGKKGKLINILRNIIIKLKVQNSKLQQKVQRLKEKHHKLCKFSRKLNEEKHQIMLDRDCT
jgi:hypothetical protein